MNEIRSEPPPSPPRDWHAWFEWPVLFTSWTFAFAVARKRGLGDADRTRVIVQMNKFYFVASTVLVAVVVAASSNRIGSVQWGPTNSGMRFRLATTVLASYCLSRCIEVFYAFFRDAFDKLAGTKPRSDLDGRKRISLALASYAELILNFAMLLSLVEEDGWQTSNANAPTHVTDVLFYSASTITTSGGGGFVPKGVVVQALTAFEIACGLILLVVCFAVYASHVADNTMISGARSGSDAAGPD